MIKLYSKIINCGLGPAIPQENSNFEWTSSATAETVDEFMF